MKHKNINKVTGYKTGFVKYIQKMQIKNGICDESEFSG